MTFNELTTIFASDDLNPNAEMIFIVSDIFDEYTIDDVSDDDDYVSIQLRGTR